MDAFAERMEARKQKELQEAAEQGKQAPVKTYSAQLKIDILGTSSANAQETLALVVKLLSGFDDIGGVQGDFV